VPASMNIFRRHDGQAVAMRGLRARDGDAYVRQHPGRDHLRSSVAGTARPVRRASLRAATTDADTRRFTLTLRQICPPVGVEKQQANAKAPFHIPFAVGLIDRDGIRSRSRSTVRALISDRRRCCFDFIEDEQRFGSSTFRATRSRRCCATSRHPSSSTIATANATSRCCPSHDPTPFNRWEASQRLAVRELVRLSQDATEGRPLQVGDALVDLFRTTLRDARLDPALKEAALMLPSEGVIGEHLETYDPAAVRPRVCS